MTVQVLMQSRDIGAAAPSKVVLVTFNVADVRVALVRGDQAIQGPWSSPINMDITMFRWGLLITLAGDLFFFLVLFFFELMWKFF